MSKRKTAAKLLLGAAACAGAYILIGEAITEIVISKNTLKIDELKNKAKAKKAPAPAPAAAPDAAPAFDAGEWWKSVNPVNVSVINREGDAIYAERIEAKSPSDVWVLCIHGYTSSARGMALYAHEFYEMGYNVLLPHMRAHSGSDHRYIGMGWLDRFDMIDWIFYILEQNRDAKIVLHGVSMGGGTVMMTTGECLPHNVKCAIEDCGYSDVWNEFKYVLKNDYKLPAFPVLYAGSLVSRYKCGYDFKLASSVDQLRKSNTPTLFIHGDKDDFVPFSMLDVNYDAAVCEKEKVVVSGAKHANAHIVNPELYWGCVKRFIDKYI